MTTEKRSARPDSKKFAAVVISGLLAFPPGSIPLAWAADAVSVDGISVTGDQAQISLSAEAKYTTRVTATPPRLIVDISGAQYNVGAKIFKASGRYLKDVRASQFKPAPELVSRVVFDLSEMTGYEVTRNDAGLLVVLGGVAAASNAAPGPDAVPGPDKEAAAPADAKVKPGEGGGMTTQPGPELADMAQRTDAALQAPAEPFKTPVQETGKAVTRGPTDIMSHLPRDLVSLDFENTDIRDVIKLLAAKAKVNIIYGPDVSGNLSLHLNDVPFDEAFRTILTMMSLSTSQVGENILRVLTPAALTRSQAAVAAATRVITLNYSKAADLLPTVNQVRAAEGRPGSAIADPKTNSIIVTESIEGLAKTSLLISQLDQKPQQVLIETKIVEVGLTKALNYGIQWDYMSIDNGRALGKQGTTTVGTIPGLPSPFNNEHAARIGGNTPVNGLDTNGLTYSGLGGQGSTGGNGRGTGVFLPANGAFGAFTLGRIVNNYMLTATLTAAATQGRVKVLSDPKVATLNNQAANINVTTQIPFLTTNTSATGAATTTVNYTTVGIQLSVTPTINADGRITLNVNPQVSQPSATAASAGGAPGVDSRNATTTVLVKDGETIVIGGLISDNVQNTIAKIPILGDIPILGWLFKKKTVTRTRTELLIFVTPKIMAD